MKTACIFNLGRAVFTILSDFFDFNWSNLPQWKHNHDLSNRGFRRHETIANVHVNKTFTLFLAVNIRLKNFRSFKDCNFLRKLFCEGWSGKTEAVGLIFRNIIFSELTLPSPNPANDIGRSGRLTDGLPLKSGDDQLQLPTTSFLPRERCRQIWLEVYRHPDLWLGFVWS